MSDWPRPETIEAAVHECYATHCILANLGFEPAEIYVGVANTLNAWPRPALCAYVKLVRGERSFIYTVRDLGEAEAAEFERQWLAFAKAKPSMGRPELDAIVHGSTIWKRKTNLLVTLARKGFTIEPGKMVH